MTARHLEFLVEEPSMEAFLQVFLPKLLPKDRTFSIHPFQGKDDLFSKLQDRLTGYSYWLPEDWKIVVVVDRDDADCRELKGRMEEIAARSRLVTRSNANGGHWSLVNRIAIEELEAWYFGDWAAVCDAYPRVDSNIPNKQPYRNSDAILGGTWEAFERVLKSYGYYGTGLRKIEAARAVAEHVDPTRNASQSFRVFVDAIREAVA